MRVDFCISRLNLFQNELCSTGHNSLLRHRCAFLIHFHVQTVISRQFSCVTGSEFDSQICVPLGTIQNQILSEAEANIQHANFTNQLQQLFAPAHFFLLATLRVCVAVSVATEETGRGNWCKRKRIQKTRMVIFRQDQFPDPVRCTVP